LLLPCQGKAELTVLDLPCVGRPHSTSKYFIV
jgi:hypothetical protein